MRECRNSIDAACERANVLRLTHCDSRYRFATICIESDVDIPAVPAWLGHDDGARSRRRGKVLFIASTGNLPLRE